MSGLKGFIGVSGTLFITRPRPDNTSVENPANCNHRIAYCSDQCVKFGEPYINSTDVMLPLCDGTILRFSKFEDRRIVK